MESALKLFFVFDEKLLFFNFGPDYRDVESEMLQVYEVMKFEVLVAVVVSD